MNGGLRRAAALQGLAPPPQGAAGIVSISSAGTVSRARRGNDGFEITGVGSVAVGKLFVAVHVHARASHGTSWPGGCRGADVAGLPDSARGNAGNGADVNNSTSIDAEVSRIAGAAVPIPVARSTAAIDTATGASVSRRVDRGC